MAYSKRLRAKRDGIPSASEMNSIRIELIHDHNIAVVIMIFGCLWSAIPVLISPRLTRREKDIDATMKVIVFIEMVEPVYC